MPETLSTISPILEILSDHKLLKVIACRLFVHILHQRNSDRLSVRRNPDYPRPVFPVSVASRDNPFRTVKKALLFFGTEGSPALTLHYAATLRIFQNSRELKALSFQVPHHAI